MSINRKFIEKYNEAYKNLPEMRQGIEFMESSPYYHQEEWRPVKDIFVPDVLPETYWISNMGNVYSALSSPKYPGGGIMSHSINGKGYHQINLQKVDGKKACVKIHRLVMLHFAFVPNCQYLEVDHLDGNKDNNCLWNLQWVTNGANVHRAIRNGQRPLSRTATFTGINLLSYEQAVNLFIEGKEIVSKYGPYGSIDTMEHLQELSRKYNTTVEYIGGLLRGSIRPYIRKIFEQYGRIIDRKDINDYIRNEESKEYQKYLEENQDNQ